MSTITVQKSEPLLPELAECPLCGGRSAEQSLRAPDRFHGRTVLYQLVRCNSCALVRLLDPPSPQAMPFHYGQGYHKTIENAGETGLDRRWSRHRNTILSLKAGGTLLDIGCSSGAFLRTLRGPAWQLHGVEISEQEARKARCSAGAEVFIGDPQDAPYRPGSFDVITCFHLLEHVYQPVELLRRLHTWLRPGGIFYVILPNIDSWEARILGSYWYGLELPRHLFHFSPSSLERALHVAHMRKVWLRTRREDSFSEHSIHYIFETLAAKAGLTAAPLAEDRSTSFPVKVARKLFRLSIEALFRYAASAAGRGASIEGVFRRD